MSYFERVFCFAMGIAAVSPVLAANVALWAHVFQLTGALR